MSVGGVGGGRRQEREGEEVKHEMKELPLSEEKTSDRDLHICNHNIKLTLRQVGGHVSS